MPQEQPDAAAAVAGLAREVEALRRGLEQLRGLPARVEQVADLVACLADVTAERTAAPAKAGAPSWLNLPDASHATTEVDVVVEDTERLLTGLVGWLGRVYLRYADAVRTLPSCWLWHPEMVEELLWLHAAWRAAYVDPHAVVSQAADWHDRLRPGVVRRVKEYAGLCSIENHQPARDGVTPAASVPLGQAVGLIAAWWATGRADPAPAPTPSQVAEAAALRPRARLRGRV